MQLKEVEALVEKEIKGLLAHIIKYFSTLGIQLKESKEITRVKDGVGVTYALYRPRFVRKNVQYYSILVPIDRVEGNWKVRSHEPLICGSEGHFLKDIEQIHKEFEPKLKKTLGIHSLGLLAIDQ